MKSLLENRSLIEDAGRSSYQPVQSKAFSEIIGKNPVKKLLLVLGDIGILYFSLYLSHAIRGSEIPLAQAWQGSLLPFTILFGIWLLVFYINDLYEIATSRNDLNFYNRTLQSLFISFAVAFGYFYLLDDVFAIKPQMLFLIFAFVTSALFPLWRYWFNSFVEQPSLRRNVLVVGLNEGSLELIHEIRQKPQLGYHI